MTVRRAAAGDATAVAYVQVAAWQAAYRGIVPDGVLDRFRDTDRVGLWQARIEAMDPAYVDLLVAEDGGAVAGFCMVGTARDEDVDRTAAGEVWALYVAPARQGRGHGTALLSAATAWLAQAGYGGGVLWVLRDNTRGRAFYERRGWASDGTERSIDIGSPLPEVRYRRALPRR